MEHEPDESFPDEFDKITFYDQEGSYRLFLALEGNTDGMGGWQIIDTLGRAWVDLPDALRHDLMQWRWLKGIGERQRIAQIKDSNG